MIQSDSQQASSLIYAVESLENVLRIADAQRIAKSVKPELNPSSGKREYFVSFSKDASVCPLKRSGPWHYGIVLDRDRLSDRYEVAPYNPADLRTNVIRIKSITAYEDDTYFVSIIGSGTVEVSKGDYYTIKDFLDNTLDEESAQRYRLDTSMANRRSSKRYKGRYRTDKYEFRNRHGIRIDLDQLGITNLGKEDGVFNTEARIWRDNDLDISGAISGIVVPSNEEEAIRCSDEEPYATLRQTMDSATQNWTITTY